MSIIDYGMYMDEAATAGKIANYQDFQADTKAAEETIRFGSAVQLGADGEGVVAVKAGGDPYGIALASEVHEYSYSKFKAVPVVRKGSIWVEAGEDVSAGEKAHVNPDDGRFYGADTATLNTIDVPTARFKSKGVAGGLVQLEINQP